MNIEQTRRAAAVWRYAGFQGIVCRSPSLFRQGFSNWQGPHQRWGELVIFAGESLPPAVLLRRREDLDWL